MHFLCSYTLSRAIFFKNLIKNHYRFRELVVEKAFKNAINIYLVLQGLFVNKGQISLKSKNMSFFK